MTASKQSPLGKGGATRRGVSPESPAPFILTHFDRIAEAPGGIAKFRALVLQLAVNGKLGTHNPKDEPFENTGRYFKKTTEKESVPVDEQFLETTPANWLWIRFEWLGEIFGGHTPSMNRADFWDGAIPWVSPKDMHVDQIAGTEMHVTEKAIAETRLRVVRPGSLFFVTRSGILKRKLPVVVNAVPCTVNQDLKVLTPHNAELTQFIRILLRGHEAMILKELVKTGTTVQSLKFDEFRNKAFPLPPLAEQQRIVAKVEELMGLCDALEAAQQERKVVRTRLRSSALYQLALPGSDFKSAAFLFEHFPCFTSELEDIPEIRQSVRQLAVTGMLSLRNPADEPATKLLARIRCEKTKITKKSASSTPVDRDEVQVAIPADWESIKLGDLCSKSGSGSTPRGGKTAYATSGIPFLRSQNVYDEGLRLEGVPYITPEVHRQMSGTAVMPSDLLLNITGGSIGRCAIVPDTLLEGNVSQHVAILRPAISGMSNYLHLVVLSPHFQTVMVGSQTGAGREGLPKNRMDEILIPLPPLAEQRRIVAKVDELMVVIDQLEATLTTVRATSVRLLAATIAQLREPKITEIIDFHSSPEFIRASLAAEIADRLRDDRYFGQTKLQKILYLAEHLFQLSEIDSRHVRYARGPHDPDLIDQVETKMKNCEWFEAAPRDNGKGKEYHPLARSGEQKASFEKLWPQKADGIRGLIDSMKSWPTERCERFATVYSAWNDLIHWGKSTDDADILDQVLNHWHPDKQNIPKSKWEETLVWMKQEGYIPTGFGRATHPAPEPELFSV
jgi:type I restriction enzyme S subunit